jgi:SNF2 family DNA or RNA helicase
MPESGAPRATLIVCPVTVIANWQHEFGKFVEENYLKVAVYIGPDRSKILTKVKRGSEFDIVLTSYETLSSDWTQYKEYLEDLEDAKTKKSHKKQSKKKARISKPTCK